MNLKTYREMIQDVAKYQEIIDLTKLRKKLSLSKDASQPVIKRINLLIETLSLATAYQERLTQMKISLRRIEAQLQKTLLERRSEVMIEDDFQTQKRKADQQWLLEQRCKGILKVQNELTAKQESVQYALDYVTSAAFNIKSIMAALKEYFSAEGVS